MTVFLVTEHFFFFIEPISENSFVTQIIQCFL